MNCTKCVSQKVCFIQKQINSLAEKMILLPFIKKADLDVSAERTKHASYKYDERMIKWDNIRYALKKVMASNCPLYLQKDQGIDGESSSIGQSTGL